MAMSSVSATNGRFVLPEVVVSQFHLRDGDVVADFGAGAGFFVPTLAQHVGASGVVYAIDVQKKLVEKISDVLRQHHLQNVRPLWADVEEEEGVEIEAESLDVALLINTLFQLEDKPAALTEVTRTLRSGGKCFVIDWSESFGGLGPEPGAVYDESAARSLCEGAGLIFERSFDAGDHHYGLAFRKP